MVLMRESSEKLPRVLKSFSVDVAAIDASWRPLARKIYECRQSECDMAFLQSTLTDFFFDLIFYFDP